MTVIGLIGVPTSGKTKLANAIKRAFPEKKYIIIDKYVEKLSPQLKMSTGFDATYIPNLHIAINREQEMRKAFLAGQNVIVCGTVFDTLCYTGFYAETVAQSADEDIKNFSLQREINAAQLFAYLCIDTLNVVNNLFYLPITDPDSLAAIPANDVNGLPGDNEILDKAMQEALRRYGNPATVLPPIHSKRMPTVLETLNADGQRSEADSSGERIN
jgi:hypothetical protein